MIKFKKILTTIVLVAIIGLHAGGTAMAYVGHTADIYLGRDVTASNTSWEEKIDDTTAFAICNKLTCESSASMRICKGIVQGSNDKNDAIGNPGASVAYDFTYQTDHRMVNSVKSDGYKYARIHFIGARNSFYTIFNFTWCAY